MDDVTARLARLGRAVGRYRGVGRNHEGEQFVGTIEIAPVAEGSGLSVVFLARAEDSATVYHSETSLIAADEAGALTLWNLGNNLGYLAPHRLMSWDEREAGATAVFRVGTGDGFTEEITLSVEDDRVGYDFAWGFPGDPMTPRSSVRMTPAGA